MDRISYSVYNPFKEMNQWVLNRELNLPLEPKQNQVERDDYTLQAQVPALWERMFFRICTGLDLTRIRELKCIYSPRFEELVEIAKNGQGEARAKAYGTKERIRLKCELDCSLESYWLDRELSPRVSDLSGIQEHLNNHKLTACQGTNCHPDSTSFTLPDRYPVQASLALRVWSRLYAPHPAVFALNHLKTIAYSEGEDKFIIVSTEIKEKMGYFPWMRQHENNINTSLQKRLTRDMAKRQTEPASQLEFIRNELYEKALAERQAQVCDYWIKSIAFAILTTVGAVIYRKCPELRAKLLSEISEIEPCSIIDLSLIHYGVNFLRVHGLQNIAKIVAVEACLFGLKKYVSYWIALNEKKFQFRRSSFARL